MRLVIDCYKLVKGAGKSIGIYNLTKTLVHHLAGSEEIRSGKDELIVLGNSHNRSDFDVKGVDFKLVPGDPLNKINIIIWELFTVVRWAKKERADRILFPRGFRPLFCPVPDAIIIHDLIPFYYHEVFPDTFNKVENAYIMNRLKASMKHADRIITISDFSRAEIDRLCPGCGDKVRVVHNGYNDVTCGEEYLTETPYIYATTTTMPHKNASGILRAYEAYRKSSSAPLDLIVIGIAGTDGYEISREAAEHVKCFKFIEKFSDMCSILKGARAFLFLSLMEGFGFPPLEAMQLGVPVVCSDRSSLPEVVGDAALTVDPENVEDVARAMERIVTDEALRAELIGKGYKNIERFSWKSRTPLYWKALKEK